MVHLRLNETEYNPNPHINFITALPMPDSQDSEEARQLLRALAAQVRPVMKKHGFSINSFEEYEYNSVFAGRNWNNGETVELVLRRANGTHCPTSWLMSTLCHELAHIKHMNHGPAFQALWARLRKEVRELQDKGYYGDGYWSSGTRLADSERVSGDGIEAGDFPEYMCGGAQTRTRPSPRRRRRNVSRRPQGTTPSLHTGRQTAKRRKPGSRVTSKFAFIGDGHSLASDPSSSKGKRALSNRAREERASAAEKRLGALVQCKDFSSSEIYQVRESASDSDSEIEFVQETDAERRRTLLDSQTSDYGEDDRSLGKGLLWKDFESEFNFSPTNQPSVSGSFGTHPRESNFIELTDDSDPDNNIRGPASPSPSYTPSGSVKVSRDHSNHSALSSEKQSGKLGIKSLVQNEVEFRKKEALGLVPTKDSYRRLGQAQKARKCNTLEATVARKQTESSTEKWNCLVCTLENQPRQMACAVCATPKGRDTYTIR